MSQTSASTSGNIFAPLEELLPKYTDDYMDVVEDEVFTSLLAALKKYYDLFGLIHITKTTRIVFEDEMKSLLCLNERQEKNY